MKSKMSSVVYSTQKKNCLRQNSDEQNDTSNGISKINSNFS